jgi:hypothetical protein
MPTVFSQWVPDTPGISAGLRLGQLCLVVFTLCLLVGLSAYIVAAQIIYWLFSLAIYPVVAPLAAIRGYQYVPADLFGERHWSLQRSGTTTPVDTHGV